MRATFEAAPARYDEGFFRNLLGQLEDLFERAWGRGEDFEPGSERVILRSPDGTRWQISVADTGDLETMEL